MSNVINLSNLTIEALSLPTQEREELTARLLRSLAKATPPSEDENLALVYQRLIEYEKGDQTTRPANEVIREVRAKYGL